MISVALLIAVTIYCKLIKYWAKQKHLLPFHDTKLKQAYINNLNWKWVMSYKVKDIDIKNRTYYFFNDIINIENLDLNNIKIDGKSCKDILICYIGYVTIKILNI